MQELNLEPQYIDLETSIKNRGEDAIGKFKASPFHPDNQIVHSGSLYQGYLFLGKDELLPHTDFVVAQNISFDLLYLLNKGYYKGRWLEWTKTGVIWDVMLAEYILTGQKVKFASLDYLAIKYGGEVKDSRIKEYWDSDVDTEDIPLSEILPYLESDVRNLEIIYKAQLDKAKATGMLPLIQSQMDARLATILMEHNGMSFDWILAKHRARTLTLEMLNIQGYILDFLEAGLPLERSEINPNSIAHVSAYLFGGDIKVVRSKPILDEDGNPVRYKSGLRKGEKKTKRCDVILSCEGVYEDVSPRGSRNVHPVGIETLSKLPKGDKLVGLLLEYRDLKKTITTYYEGYSSLVFPDGCIHGSLNHCQTDTGRLSSSSPNLQNISNKES